MDWINFIRENSNLINFALLIIIVGWLFKLTSNYKDALKAKFDAEISQKDTEIKNLSERINSQNQHISNLEREYENRIKGKDEELEIRNITITKKKS